MTALKQFLPKPKSPFDRYVLIIFVAWTLSLVTSLWWNINEVRHSTMDNALVQARVAFAKDILYRRWAALHGGVYVPIDDRTSPNPYLQDVPERDITTPLGVRLTLMNPAYMTRQIFEIQAQDTNVYGHITSLNPIRPENAADEWETDALKSFEQGNQETSELTTIDGKPYLRLMRPLIAQKECLVCHAQQGYKEGEIRGGLSTSVPMEPLLAIENDQIRTIALAHLVIWLLGTIGTALGAQRISKSERERTAVEDLLRYQRNHDVLTGLYNRAFFEEEMDRLENSRMFPISIIIADVDDLKPINDVRGHSAGDELIKQTAYVLKASVRAEDIIARIGGDEFAIILPLTNEIENEDCLQRIKNTLTVYQSKYAMPHLNLSLGGATASEKQQALSSVMRLADERMYQEKHARKKMKTQARNVIEA
ncbi:MAG: diguanylate cyclase [Chloroflexi bacterium]|nr:diguanylate cyclase [Chloroflexota bacterium]